MKNYENFEFSSYKEKIDYLIKLKEEKELKELEDQSGNKVVYPTITNNSNNYDTENSLLDDNSLYNLIFKYSLRYKHLFNLLDL